MITHVRSTQRIYLLCYLALLVLLGLTVGASRTDLGIWNLPVALSIATIKGVLIVAFFMHVRHGATLVKLVVTTGLCWLAILFTLCLADVRSRSWDWQIRASFQSDDNNSVPHAGFRNRR